LERSRVRNGDGARGFRIRVRLGSSRSCAARDARLTARAFLSCPDLGCRGGLGGLSSLWACSPRLFRECQHREVWPRAAPARGLTAVGAKGGGHYMVVDPYRIAGKTTAHRKIHPAQAALPRWTASDFHGLETANGESTIFARYCSRARQCRLPSYARVTNLAKKGQSINRAVERSAVLLGRIMDSRAPVSRKPTSRTWHPPGPLEPQLGRRRSTSTWFTLLASYREPRQRADPSLWCANPVCAVWPVGPSWSRRPRSSLPAPAPCTISTRCHVIR